MANIRFFSRPSRYFICWIIMISILLIMRTSSQAQDTAQLIEGAKKEGKVIFYSAMALEDCDLMAKEFEKQYPFLKVETLRMSGEKLLIKALTEARAKSLKADIFQASIIQVSQMKKEGLLARYVSPESNAFPAKFKDPEGFWNATYLLPYVITYNTKLISPKDAPKSYADLLNQKLKGKIGIDAEEIQWFFHLIKIMGREKGIEFMKAFAKQNLMIRTGHTLLVTLCGSGEIPIVTVGYLDCVDEVKSQGAPIEWVRFESSPIITAINAISMVSNTPHPNAAKLFYNFVISKEGARVFRKVFRVPANPDEQTPEIKAANLYPAHPEELLANYKQAQKEWEEIFRPPK